MRIEVEIFADDLLGAVDELAQEIGEIAIIEILEYWKKEEPVKYETFCKIASPRLGLVDKSQKGE